MLSLIGMVGVVAVMVVGWLLLDHSSPLNQASAIDATQEWGRLAEFPKTSSDLRIEVTGSSFTRGFRISFRDTPANVAAWIAASPGPASAVPVTGADGWTVYEYSAGGGATFAEARVSPDGSVVKIETYWS